LTAATIDAFCANNLVGRKADRLMRRWILIGSSEQKNRKVSMGGPHAAASRARNVFGWAEEIHRRGLV
jgi:hypothetical protein